MPFTNLALQIEDILQTDFVPDAFTKVNSNFSELQGNFESLINDMEIDFANGKIGSVDPITSINTQSIILDAGSLIFLNSSSSQVASLTLDGSDKSVLSVDSIVSDVSIEALDISSSGVANLAQFTATGPIALQGKTTFTKAPAYTPSLVNINLTYNSGTNYAEGTLTLSASSPKHNFLKIITDSATYSGSFNVGILGIKIKIVFDGSTPPDDGSEFTIGFAQLLSGSTDITSAWAGLSLSINLIPDTTIAIQNNAIGVLGTPISFQNIQYKSNITFMKASFGSVPRLLIIAEKNMND